MSTAQRFGLSMVFVAVLGLFAYVLTDDSFFAFFIAGWTAMLVGLLQGRV